MSWKGGFGDLESRLALVPPVGSGAFLHRSDTPPRIDAESDRIFWTDELSS
jgi:hypothetical protein